MAGNAIDPRRSVISKVSAIISTFAEGDSHCLTEIAARSHLPVSTVHRLVTELAAWRILDRDDGGRYWAGSPLRVMGSVPHSPTPGVRDHAAPIMDDLGRVTGTAVRFGVLANGRIAYLSKPAPEQPVSEFSAAATLPVHACAMGKVVLAFSPREVVDVVISHGLPVFTRRTVTRPDDLRKALRLIRMRRLAHVAGDLRSGESAVAAPVFGAGGQVVAAIEVSTADRHGGADRVLGPLTMAANGLSRELARAACRSDLDPPQKPGSGSGTADGRRVG